MENESERRQLDEQLTKLYNEDKMYLKSCNTDWSDIKVHYEYPAGAVFAPHENSVLNRGIIYNTTAYVSDNRTGDVSADGKWLYVTVFTYSEAERSSKRKEARISLETGEIEYP